MTLRSSSFFLSSVFSIPITSAIPGWFADLFHCWRALFKIVLGLMCPGRPSRGGESQNEAKSRRFGMDMPCRAFYEGVNPKTILNNGHQLCFNRHRRRNLAVRQPKSALCHLPEGLADTYGSLVPKRLVNDVPYRAFQRGYFHQTILNNRHKSTNRHHNSASPPSSEYNPAFRLRTRR